MRNLQLIAPVLLVLFVSQPSRAEETKTGLTIDSVQVVARGDEWEITVTGKVSLSKDDTLNSSFLENLTLGG
jgi:hypothetical protein